MQSRHSAVIIPAYNPDWKLVDYIRSLISYGFQMIIVVNDGSKADCDSIFDQISSFPECVLLAHAINLGKGRALKSAFNYYLVNYASKYNGVITVDSDGQHTADDVAKVEEVMDAEQEALILGTRNFDDESVPWKSRFGNKVTKNTVKLIWGGQIHDTQTGLRGIPNCILPTYLALAGERFEFEMNMLIEALKSHMSICELPIQTVYINGNEETHFRPIADSLAIYMAILGNFVKYTLSSLASFLIDYVLFCLIDHVCGSFSFGSRIWISSIGARIGSSAFNYCTNKRLVFASDARGTLAKYYSLCVIQLLCSALIVWILCGTFSVSEVIVKPIVDGLLFLISYRVQQRWVFGEARK